MSLLQALILAVVEGITEFLPISSTGHMIITSSFMGIAEEEFTKTFTVAIQFGAIVSVVVLYWKKFIPTDGDWNRLIRFYKRLLVAFIPAAVLGKLFDDYIDALLGNVYVVAFMLVLGGIFLVFIDVLIKENLKESGEHVTYKSAFKIGLFQCLAMVPGVSRSAATIVGGLLEKLNRKAAAEFSFFLAVPTMFAATVYKVYTFYKAGIDVRPEHIKLLVVGNVVAFLVAILAIRSFIGFLTRHGLQAFGYYRIAIGLFIIILLTAGVDLRIAD